MSRNFKYIPLKENQINWDFVSENINEIELLIKNKDNWTFSSRNQNIITYDNLKKMKKSGLLEESTSLKFYNYKQMKENIKKSGIAEELMSVIFHPKNIKKWKDWGFTEYEEMLDLID